MSQLPEESSGKIAALEAEVAAMKRRDAEFRANMVKEFLDHGERNTYVHTLHEQRAALLKREQEASGDLEILTRKLEVECARADALEAVVARVKGSLSWRLTAPLRWVGRLVGPRPASSERSKFPAQVEGAPFTYYLHTSPFRVFRGAAFTLKGWAWPEDGRELTGIRVNLGGRVFEGRIGLEEPEVVARYGPQKNSPRPGFEITFETPPGRQILSLEGRIGSSEWRCIMRTTVWCERNPS